MKINTTMIRSTLIRHISGKGKEMFHSRRLFSSLHDSKTVVMLTSAIDSIYNDEWRVRGVLPIQKDNLLSDLLEL